VYFIKPTLISSLTVVQAVKFYCADKCFNCLVKSSLISTKRMGKKLKMEGALTSVEAEGGARGQQEQQQGGEHWYRAVGFQHSSRTAAADSVVIAESRLQHTFVK